jgi:hypothetical protein
MKQYYWIPKLIESRHEEHGYGRRLHAPSPLPPLPLEAPPEEESDDELKSRVIVIDIASGEEEI